MSNLGDAFLNSVLKTATDAIIIINDKGLILLINDSASSLFGYSKEELLNQNVRIITPEPHHSNHDTYIADNIKSGINKVIGLGRDVIGVKKNGEPIPIRLAISKFVWNNNLYFTGVMHDLTIQKEIEHKLVFINKNLEELVDSRTKQLMESVNQLRYNNTILEKEINDRTEIEKKLVQNEKELLNSLEKERNLHLLKSRFVSLASHEFKTPLANILSSINLIEHYTEFHESEKCKPHLTKIKSNIHYLNGILNEFLNTTRFEEGKFEINLQELNITDEIREIIDDLDQLKKSEQKLIFDSQLIPSFHIKSDRNCIRHILTNLIMNAIKYSDKQAEIKIKLSQVSQFAQVIITDKGIGIPEEEQKFIFDLFYRCTNVINIPGSGLGLSIVKKYLELLEGELKIHSIEGIGTEITLLIPINE